MGVWAWARAVRLGDGDEDAKATGGCLSEGRASYPLNGNSSGGGFVFVCSPAAGHPCDGEGAAPACMPRGGVQALAFPTRCEVQSGVDYTAQTPDLVMRAEPKMEHPMLFYLPTFQQSGLFQEVSHSGHFRWTRWGRYVGEGFGRREVPEFIYGAGGAK